MKILSLLLRHNYASEPWRESWAFRGRITFEGSAGSRALSGENWLLHYDVKRDVLRALAFEIEALASTERETSSPQEGLTPSNRSVVI